MRNALATRNLVAVSALNRESALNVWQELDTSLLCGLGDGLELVPQREPLSGVVGHEEPAEAPLAYSVAKGGLGFERAQPHQFAFALSFGLGQVVSEPIGTGFRHTITPLSGDLDPGRSNPSFTCAVRYGEVLKRRFASCFIEKLSATFARNEWCRLSADLVATGRHEGNLIEDEIEASRNATQLTLTQGVEGSSPGARLDNLHRLRAELASGEWHEVTVLSVSGDSPAQVTIAPPGGSGDCRYRVLYVATEPGWTAFPAPVSESPLHIRQVTLNVGGLWDGTELRGGRQLSAELHRLEWTLANHFELSATAGGGPYAGLALRGRREQRLTLLREMRCGSLQRQLEGQLGDDDTFCLQLAAEGAEFAPGEPYRVELIWPRVTLLRATPGARGTRLTEEALCLPLEGEDTPSVIARVTNRQPAYAA